MADEPQAPPGPEEPPGRPVFPQAPQWAEGQWVNRGVAGEQPGEPASWPSAGAGPAGPSGYDTEQSPAGPGEQRRRRPLAWAAGLAAIVLVAGGAGAALALALNNGGHPAPPGSVANGPAGRANSSASGPQSFNVHIIASHVEAATVDITAKGSGGVDEGTGMILASSGVVLTNNHVIDGSTQLSAQVDGSGQTYRAKVLGTDASGDVALLQLEGGPNFKTVELGNSGVITVGDPVVAIGNALGLSGPETVTNGIISATGRSITVGDPASGLSESLKGLFQSSAPINPGNSGGPLVDAAGRVIGMNTAEESGTGSGQDASNVGFAIPINAAMEVARQIEAGKASATVQIGPHAIMGVEVTTVACAEGGDGCAAAGTNSPFGFSPVGGSSGNYTAPVSKGAVIEAVEQGDPAQAAGLAAGDVITSINGVAITSPTELTNHLNLQRVGDKVTVGWVELNGRHRSATLSLVQGPNI